MHQGNKILLKSSWYLALFSRWGARKYRNSSQ